MRFSTGNRDSQVFGPPLHFFHHVQCRVHDELIHMGRLLAELGCAIASWLGRAELVFEDGVVFCPDDGEIVRHGRRRCFYELCVYFHVRVCREPNAIHPPHAIKG